MKLFVWVDPYPVSYGSSLVFAVASDLEEARKVAKSGGAYAYGRHLQDHSPGVELGEPDRVLPLPCAEWHEWSE